MFPGKFKRLRLTSHQRYRGSVRLRRHVSACVTGRRDTPPSHRPCHCHITASFPAHRVSGGGGAQPFSLCQTMAAPHHRRRHGQTTRYVRHLSNRDGVKRMCTTTGQCRPGNGQTPVNNGRTTRDQQWENNNARSTMGDQQ